MVLNNRGPMVMKTDIRCVVRPDKAQALLLDRLGLELPERLRIPPKLVASRVQM